MSTTYVTEPEKNTEEAIMTPFLYFLIITLILAAILGIYSFWTMHTEERARAKKAAHIARLREQLTPYDFYRTVQSAVNQSFSFGNLRAGDRVRIRQNFTDYYGYTYTAGTVFHFASAYFLPYEDGYTLFVSYDGSEISCIYLQMRPESQSYICEHPEAYFEVRTPADPE